MPVTRKKLTAGKLLRWSRRLLQSVCFILVTLFFAGAGSLVAIKLKWTASVQIIPVALSASLSLILFWILTTLIFGRIYCSTLCPMGFIQDAAARLRRLTRRQRSRRPYRYVPGKPRLRISWLFLIILTSVAGTPLLLSLFDPYGAFGRVITMPAAALAQTETTGTIALGTIIGLTAAIVTLIIIAMISSRSGRTFCNTLCPVGTTLGLLSRHSIFRMDINTDLCIQCRRCEHVCKSRCINLGEHTVDTSRCVVCFDCVDACDSKAITYTNRRHRLSIPLMMKITPPAAAGMSGSDNISNNISAENSGNEKLTVDRRRFLLTGLIAAATPAIISAEKKLRRIEAIEPLHNPSSGHRPVTPPGITSLHSFLNHCVGCGACIAACPAKVLKPASNEYGWQRSLRPVMNYDENYCRYNCTVCTRVCPTSALTPLTIDEKHTAVIGIANVDRTKCIGCGLCVSRCPHKAIAMKLTEGKRAAVVDRDKCIGCGSCQYICPATPDRAIVVSGIQ